MRNLLTGSLLFESSRRDMLRVLFQTTQYSRWSGRYRKLRILHNRQTTRLIRLGEQPSSLQITHIKGMFHLLRRLSLLHSQFSNRSLNRRNLLTI